MAQAKVNLEKLKLNLAKRKPNLPKQEINVSIREPEMRSSNDKLVSYFAKHNHPTSEGASTINSTCSDTAS